MSDLPKIDWEAERDAMKALAYFRQRAMDASYLTATDRGLSPEERGRKLMAAGEDGPLPDAEIERLNAARQRNGGEL